MAERIRMPYRQYKQHYSDCFVVSGTYDSADKTIIVEVPDGRMKKSGVRGEHFRGYSLYCINSKGVKCHVVYRAVSLENALKQHKRACKENNWQYLEEVEHVFT